MRAIIKKLHLCLSCLSAPGKDHKYPVGKCRRCGGAHNVIICTKEEEEKGLIGREQDETSEEDSEDEAYDDFKNNRDNVNLAKAKSEAKKEKPSPKEGKKDKEQGDEEIISEPSEVDKKQRLAKLKEVLANISADYEKGRQEFCGKNNPTSILRMKERVCLVRVARMDSESGELEEGIDSCSDESQETEVSESKTGSSDDESRAEADLIQKVISEEETSIEEGSTGSTSSDQEEEKYLPKEVRPDQCTLSDSEPEEAKTNNEVETSSEEWTEDSDESGYEKAYFISSAANIRRRELHGQPRYKEKTV